MNNDASESASIKELNNSICAGAGCTKPSRKRIMFDLGFSACFCYQCGNELVREGIGETAKFVDVQIRKPYATTTLKTVTFGSQPDDRLSDTTGH
ncbi:MAG: hypothetical protein M3P08_12300 [Thermoproteota archaeon]|nr:hypothetical protein [Thermoproteota archaeon]